MRGWLALAAVALAGTAFAAPPSPAASPAPKAPPIAAAKRAVGSHPAGWAVIVLAPKDGTCGVATVTPLLTVDVGGRATWTVQNGCPNELAVCVDRFSPNTKPCQSGTGKNCRLFEPDKGKLCSGSVPAGEARPIEGKVKAAKIADDRYKYAVTDGTDTLKDPEIEIIKP